MTYEGWANYHTWNVALWISNDEPLYAKARHYATYMIEREGHDGVGLYEAFTEFMPPEYGDITGDGVSWNDPTLDHDALDAFMRELAE